jgi:hypothetical protein
MTKIERSEASKAMYYASMGAMDLAARTMSANIRATRSVKTRNELLTMAAGYPALVQHAEFIVN